MNTKSVTIFLSLKIILIITVNGDRVKDYMYEPFNGRTSCFRWLNATHQTGCSSKWLGSVGVLHLAESKPDLEFVLKKGNAGQYMPIIPTHLLDYDLIKMLTKSDIVAGLVVYTENNVSLKAYSHEQTCPNRQSNVEGTCNSTWNKYGTGILHEDIPFPIYYVEDNDDLQKIRDCFQKFNNYSYETQYTRSLCVLSINTYMFATTNTPTCIRRSNQKLNLNTEKFCDPISGENIWSALFPIENNTKNEYIMVAGRTDSLSLFNKIYPGAISPITGIISLLAIADLLKRMVVEDGGKPGKNVLFALFGGESFDYMGSQRFLYDMQNDQFPMAYDPDFKTVPLIHLDDIKLYVELSQLSKSSALYAHINKNSSETASFFTKLKQYSSFTTVHEYGIRLPPSSLQSFVKAKSNISGIVIADHGEEYVNKFYNSIYDDADNIKYHYYNITSEDDHIDIPHDSIQYFVANVSEAVARSLFEEVMNKKYSGIKKPRMQFIDELFHCYLEDEHCKIHKAIQRKTEADVHRSSYSFYSGVSGIHNLLTYAIGLTLGWVTGDIVTQPNGTCSNDPKFPLYQYLNMSKSLDNQTFVCYRTTLNFTDGLSPAFIIPDYDWKSGKYSSWSESAWKDFSVRMFLKPSAAHERFTMAIGSVTFIMSLILVYFIKSRSNVLFITPRVCSPTVC